MQTMKIIAIIACVLALTLSVFGQRPSGIHFDVEPAALPGGAEGNAADYISLLNKLKAITTGVTKLSADIPMGMGAKPLGAWYYQNRPIGHWVADIVDTVTLMAYRDKAPAPNGVIDQAQNALNYAKTIGKNVVVGVETNCGVGDIVSFCEEGQSYMETQLLQVDSTLKSYGNTYGGLAVHDYEGYIALAPNVALPASAPCRGMWVWTHSVVTDTAARKTFIDFAKRMRVCTVYQESQGLVTGTKATQLKSFITDLWNNGIKTELLFGAHEWALAANHGQATTLCRDAVNFINSFPSNGVPATTGAVSTPSTTGARPSTTGAVSNTGGACTNAVAKKRSRVADGNDDVEENIKTGQVSCTSSDLEMVKDGKVNQMVGLRFKNIDVNPEDVIVKAYFEFKADVSSTEKTNLIIQAENTVNSANSLCGASLSGRPKTSNTVSWSNVPSWTKGQVYQSADITPLVKEIVATQGWKSGNAMTFMISGSGLRSAYSYNGGNAPYLVIEVQAFGCGQGEAGPVDTEDWWAEGTTPVTDDDLSASPQFSYFLGLIAAALVACLF